MVYGGKNGGQNGFSNKFSMYLDTAYQNPGYELTSGGLHGLKISKDIKTLNTAKLKKW